MQAEALQLALSGLRHTERRVARSRSRLKSDTEPFCSAVQIKRSLLEATPRDGPMGGGGACTVLSLLPFFNWRVLLLGKSHLSFKAKFICLTLCDIFPEFLTQSPLFT